jgi:putative aldouronate transport system permease protein
MSKKNTIRMPMGERIGKIIMIFVLCLAGLAAIYPFLYVFSMSISSAEHVLRRDVFLYPKGIGLDGYNLVFSNSNIWMSYGNTLFYTIFGTAINVVLTILAAYPLSRPGFVLRRPLSLFITFTMFFGGGMIPFFIVISRLGLYNTRWGVLLPFAVSAWNIIIARTFYESIPEALIESATIDGAGNMITLIYIVLPLSTPILSVLALFYAVGHWNSYFWPLVLLPNNKLQPLQIYLYKILVQLKQDTMGGTQIGISRTVAAEQFKYSSIIVSILPIMLAYPFLQKYFVKGVMIGAVKG